MPRFVARRQTSYPLNHVRYGQASESRCWATFRLVVTASLLVWWAQAEDLTRGPATNRFAPVYRSAGADLSLSNLLSFYPRVALADFDEMVRTNGLVCLLDIVRRSATDAATAPEVLVQVLNRTTNDIGCLNLPATDLCQVALFDRQGRVVKLTPSGAAYGRSLSPTQVDAWRRGWKNSHLGIVKVFHPTAVKGYGANETDLCLLNLFEAFELNMPGEYDLHVRIRVVQAGQKSSGDLCYLMTWLPEVRVSVKIEPEDITRAQRARKFIP